MKTYFYFIVLFLFAMSCSDDTNTNDEQENKVLLLQVDFMTNTFEGGKEYNFNNEIEDFTISSDYQAPGDFGNIALYYDELDEMLFDGSIVWMGLGHRAYPQDLMSPIDFTINTNPVSIPLITNFEKVMYSGFSYYPETINYSEIWNSIANLQRVTDFRNSNPNSKVHVFLYTPSVGVGDPNEWDWIIFLKN